ncbi:MAG: ABC transporter ATP-binding protein [Chloroflexi bacterium]|jgi:branched-chain amino acid transport system ATP-binding protein|nr:MAG: ABC transporter-like protein [Chloroflexi bacterium OLB13]MBC6954647.1 ABC transporter ATP-binding protein [Chloroflexota bacterium]MBV6435984.1 Lipopolysaccharide export system ATP-binding protein LptB [Anaerolineae bacterium]MDL1914595.1 ABC transporter ATP-binding protein [Anaerolineae bacterium CFX4]OQY85834.1 MAG: ABC transporter ATP-binding protein [Anaerolineae bacterium UTCFX5]
MTPILETRSLTKAFGGLVAVNDVSIQVEEGSTHAVIGPNGAGKTTLFNLLCGNFKPTSGRVFYRGQDITNVPLHQRAHLGIGRSFQIINLFPNLTVLENVRLAAQALGHDNFRIFRRASTIVSYVARAAEALEIVGLQGQASVPASVLPHGGKRKLELAILLAADPKLLLLDEPTAGMASEQVPELMQIIERVRSLGGRTIVIVEHNMNVVMNACDRITVMNLGQVLAEGTPAEIGANKQVQDVYLGELYDLPGAHA